MTDSEILSEVKRSIAMEAESVRRLSEELDGQQVLK